MLGADPVIGADQSGFDVAEQSMDDQEELAGIGAVVLDHRGVLQILTEIGLGAAIASKPVGQQMRIGGDIGFEEAPQFDPGRGRQHGLQSARKSVLRFGWIAPASLSGVRPALRQDPRH